jgi:hypothetical protein
MKRLLHKIANSMGFQKVQEQSHTEPSNQSLRPAEDGDVFVRGPQQLQEDFHANKISGSDFNKMSSTIVVDSNWLKKKLLEGTEGHDWKRLNELLPFVPRATTPEINEILGKALRGSFDDLIAEDSRSVWGTPELIVDALSENDPKIIRDLAHVCCVPLSKQDWYLDYRKAVDAIERTVVVPVNERVGIFREMIGKTEIDELNRPGFRGGSNSGEWSHEEVPEVFA